MLTEALSLERPIIATHALVRPKEILGDGRYGLLVPPDDVDGLADGLVRLANDEHLRADFTSRGLEGARRYSAQTIARRLCDLAAELTF